MTEFCFGLYVNSVSMSLQYQAVGEREWRRVFNSSVRHTLDKGLVLFGS